MCLKITLITMPIRLLSISLFRYSEGSFVVFSISNKMHSCSDLYSWIRDPKVIRVFSSCLILVGIQPSRKKKMSVKEKYGPLKILRIRKRALSLPSYRIFWTFVALLFFFYVEILNPLKFIKNICFSIQYRVKIRYQSAVKKNDSNMF